MNGVDVIEEVKYRDHLIQIKVDKYLEEHNPRDGWNLGKMICWHPNYILGDEQINTSHYASRDHLLEEFEIDKKEALILPLFLYVHSGITMNTYGFSDIDYQGWDWSYVGIIYVTKEMVDEAGLSDLSDEELYNILEREVKDYSSFLEGDIVCFTIYDESNEVVDSLGGYVGNYNGAIQDAKKIIDYHIEKKV